MKRGLFAIIVLLSAWETGPREARAEKPALAVLEFKVRGMEAGREDLGRMMAEIFSVKLGDHFRVLERVQVRKVIETKKFENTDFVEEPAKAAEVGKLARAKFIMVGSLNKIGEEFLLVAKIIKCETGEQFAGGTSTFKGMGEMMGTVDKVVKSMGFGDEDPKEEKPPTLPRGFELVRPGLYRCVNDRALMVHVPAGRFEMGSENLGPAEKPVHRVSLKGFLIDLNEVTNRMFAKFLDFSGEDRDEDRNRLVFEDRAIGLVKKGSSWIPVEGYEDYPVVRVTWYGASAYAKWAGKELPTEAAWEYAARGSDGRKYPWGNKEPDGALAVFGRSGFDRTRKAGMLQSGESPFGVRDMAGNVSEWCRDWFDPRYYQSSPFANPLNDEEAEQRSLRGGSWKDAAMKILAPYRSSSEPLSAADTIGFRCLKTLE